MQTHFHKLAFIKYTLSHAPVYWTVKRKKFDSKNLPARDWGEPALQRFYTGETFDADFSLQFQRLLTNSAVKNEQVTCAFPCVVRAVSN